MEIYVDVLIFINMVVDFYLLCAVSSLLKIKVSITRKLLASFVAALFSLYIFLPEQLFFIELLMRVIPAGITVAICFGISPAKSFFRALAVFYAVSFLYFGLMAGLWMLFEPSKMSLNNGVVYFDVSPLLLITFSFLFYAVIVIVKRLTQRSSEFAKSCSVNLKCRDIELKRTAMVDSGHSLNDMFSNSIVLIVDYETSVEMFGKNDTDLMILLKPPANQELALRFRMIPIKTVSTEKIMSAIRLDSADVQCGNRQFHLHKPIAVISEGKLSCEYSVIIPPEAINL